jgi:hypothetical protein
MAICDCGDSAVSGAIGRPSGTGVDGASLLAKHKDVVEALKAGQSIRNEDKITGQGWEHGAKGGDCVEWLPADFDFF